MANQIVAEIVLDLDTLKGQLKDAQDESKKAAQKTGEEFGGGLEKSITKSFGSIQAKLIALAGTIASGFAFKKIIEEASAGDDAIQRFNSALRATNAFSSAASLSFQKYADELQSITTFSNDAITSNAALLVSVGNLTGQGLERATKAALDLSSGLNIDLQSAFQMVAKAAQGSTGSFGRFGIRIQETGNTAKNFEQILGQIQQRFGGAAEDRLRTFGGAVDSLGNNFSDLLKELGRMITQSPLVVGVIRIIGQWFGTLAEQVKAFTSDTDRLKQLSNELIKIGLIIAQYIIPPFELLFNIGKAAFDVIVTGAQGLIVILATAVQGLLEITTLFTDKFVGARDTVKQIAQDTGQVFVDMANNTSQSFKDTFNFSFTSGAEELLMSVQTFTDSFNEKIDGMADNTGQKFDQMGKDAIEMANKIRSAVGTGLVSVISGTTQRLGAALIKGGDAFGDFKNFALNAIGDMSIRMGEAMIVQSAAFQALAALITNPFTAAGASLAFGLALVAIGGLLKAAAGGGGAAGAGAGSAGAGGGGIASTIGGETTQLQEATRQEPGTSLVVNVQGNILDRRETGLHIAEVIQETFGSNNIQFGTGNA